MQLGDGRFSKCWSMWLKLISSLSPNLRRTRLRNVSSSRSFWGCSKALSFQSIILLSFLNIFRSVPIIVVVWIYFHSGLNAVMHFSLNKTQDRKCMNKQRPRFMAHTTIYCSMWGIVPVQPLAFQNLWKKSKNRTRLMLVCHRVREIPDSSSARTCVFYCVAVWSKKRRGKIWSGEREIERMKSNDINVIRPTNFHILFHISMEFRVDFLIVSFCTIDII